MAQQHHHRSPPRRGLASGVIAGVIVVVVAVAGVVLAAVELGGSSSPRSVEAAGHDAPATTPPPPPPLLVSAARPAGGASDVSGTSSFVFTTSEPIDLLHGDPTISPAIGGSWSETGDQITFTPSVALPPSTTITVTFPSGMSGGDGAVVSHPFDFSYTTENGSVLRLQELLAELGYLPLKWTPSEALSDAPANLDAEVYSPPAGFFSWTWSDPPASLADQWSPGSYTTMVKGAVMAFESDHGLTTDGLAGHDVWEALLAAVEGPSLDSNPHGYTYSYVTKTPLPEKLTVWHDGAVIQTSNVNTGIPVAPTADGTYPVFDRLANQIMKGTNPDGSKYADPVAWVAYFNGGDAIHYIARASYGFPQSLGCVEVPYNVGKHIWPYETIGSLVTVTG